MSTQPTGPDDATVDAGDFARWVVGMADALRSGAPSDVPCGSCTACCRSSQFVHVAPDETDTLTRIPSELLFPAPGLPPGHLLLGYDRDGRCPMLGDGGCEVYDHRPRTCRAFDCRVFTAAGLDPALDGRPLIAARTSAWRFALPGAEDRARLAAVRAAAAYLRGHPGAWPTGDVPGVTAVALASVELHEVFLQHDGDRWSVVEPSEDCVRDAVLRRHQDTGGRAGRRTGGSATRARRQAGETAPR